MHPQLTTIIQDIKSSHSIPDYLATLCSIRRPAIGTAICAPSFIRSDDSHPSFGIYDTIAIDFATGTRYDVIDLCMKALNLSFLDAVEHLHGSPIFDQKRKDTLTVELTESQKVLNRKVDYWHSELLKNADMLGYLHGRGFTDESITRFKLGWSAKRGRLMIPYSTGSRWCNYTGRDMVDEGTPNNPQKIKHKYQKAKMRNDDGTTPPEAACFLSVPWGLQTIHQRKSKHHTYKGIDDNDYTIDAPDPRDDTLCITEGNFDGAILAQDGWQTLAFSGGRIGADYKNTFLDIARSYKQVCLMFDNDKFGQGFTSDWSRILYKHHIPFVCANIPERLTPTSSRPSTYAEEGVSVPPRLSKEGGLGGEVCSTHIKDINDYYLAGGDLADLVINSTPGLVYLARQTQTLDELASLFRDASQWNPSYKIFELKEACYSLIDPKTGFQKYTGKMINHLYAMSTMAIPEMDVARIVNSKHTLIFDTAGTFYEYTRGIWEQVSDFEIQRYVGEALGMKASSGRMRSVTNYLKAEHATVSAFNRKNVIVLKNGTIHLDDVIKDLAAAFKPHNPEDMSTIQVPCNYDPDASCSKWLKYVADVCGDNPAKMKLMQQMAGYVMCPDNRFHKFFYLLGDGRNGKSVFMNVLEAVYGSDNCSSVQPSRLGSQFDPIALKDSLANFCYEAKSILNGSEEALKAVVAGDPIMAAHKGVDAVKFTTRAKIFIAANKCFASDDVSLGFLSRIIFFKFDKQFLGKDANKNLYSELLKELPGIFNWCLMGFVDLMKSGGFQELEEQADVIDDLLTQMSPTGLFIKEMFPLQRGIMSDRDIYACYKHWCDDGGFKRLNRIEFMKDLMLLIRQNKHNIGMKVSKTADGKRIFIFPPREEEETDNDEVRQERESVIALGAGPAASDGEGDTSEEGSPQAQGADSEDNSRREHSMVKESVDDAESKQLRPEQCRAKDENMGAARQPDSQRRTADTVNGRESGSTPTDSGQAQSNPEGPTTENNASADKRRMTTSPLPLLTQERGTDNDAHSTAFPLSKGGLRGVAPQPGEEVRLTPDQAARRALSAASRHFTNPADLAGFYLAGTLWTKGLPLGKLTLGDWDMLKDYFLRNPDRVWRTGVPFWDEYRKYTALLEESFREDV